MSEDKVTLHIGGLEDMGRRFVRAWRAAEQGGGVDRDHVTFLTLEAFQSALSPKRLELLKALRAEGPMSVRRLGSTLGRDYKSVHQDVALLREAGLIVRLRNDAVAVPWARAVTEVDLAA